MAERTYGRVPDHQIRQNKVNQTSGETEEKIKEFINKKLPWWTTALGMGVVAGWLSLSSFYMVSSSEEAVVTRFGAYSRSAGPGPHTKLSWPIEKVTTVDVAEVQRLEIGFRTIPETNPAKYEDKPEESHMLTGDENIVNMDLVIQYLRSDPIKYIFSVKDPERTLMDIGEATIRQIAGDSSIDAALTSGRTQIQERIKEKLSQVAASYDLGVKIVAVQLQDVIPPAEVEEAFKDVQKAKEDKMARINKAQAYRNDLIPKARGAAQKLLNEAQGYATRIKNTALGDADRFSQVLKGYRTSPQVTRDRMYIETMEKVYPSLDKIIDGSNGGNGGTLKLLDLNSLVREKSAPEESGKRRE